MSTNAFGLIYTGDTNLHMRDLTMSRATAAVPFGGRYRCIDFILSDLVNSGVTCVGLITQRNYHSLMDHLGSGKEWDLHRKRNGLFILPPFMTKENTGLYRGSIDAFHSCMGYVRRCTEKYAIIATGCYVFNTSFKGMLKEHEKSGADVSILYSDAPEVEGAEQVHDLRLTMEDDGTVTQLEYNSFRPKSKHRSIDVMIIEKDLFLCLVEDAFAVGKEDFIRDVLQARCGELRIRGQRYDGFVGRINSIAEYYHYSMELLKPEVQADLFDPKHPIYTKVKDEVSACYGPEAKVKNALVADGCEIDGRVEDSILFRGVTVGEGTVIRNSILTQGVTIGKNCVIDHVIMDKGVTVRDDRTLMGYENFPVILKKNAVI